MAFGFLAGSSLKVREAGLAARRNEVLVPFDLQLEILVSLFRHRLAIERKERDPPSAPVAPLRPREPKYLGRFWGSVAMARARQTLPSRISTLRLDSGG